MGSFKSVFDPLDLEIMDRVYEVAWAHVQAREPSRNTASDGARQEALRRKIFGVARIAGPGHIDFDTLTEVVLATISEQPEPERSPSVENPEGTAVFVSPAGLGAGPLEYFYPPPRWDSAKSLS